MTLRVQRIAGVDGCRGGWIVVEADCDLSKAALCVAPNWNAINSRAAIIAVDMPIGVSERGVRQCEVEARRLLSPCASRVFKTLPRAALRFSQDDWNAANQWSKRQGFGGLSKQIWNIRPKIKEIDNVITPTTQTRVWEAHPELAFARLNGGRPLDSKRTKAGLAKRKEMLEAQGFTNLDNWLREISGRRAKADDLFDACVLVLTARNILQGCARQVPALAERDSRGLRMSIAF